MSLWPFIVIQVIIFVGLVLLLRRILTRNLIDAAAHLQGLSAEYARRQEELKQQLQQSEREYQEQISKAQAASEQLLAKAREDADSSKVKVLSDARAEGERIIQQALQSSNGLKSDFEEQVDHRALQRACELIQQVLPGQMRKEMQSGWLDELIHDGFAQMDQLTTEDGIKEARVVVAFPLNESQRDQLRQSLKKKLGRDIPLTESTDEGLVAGLTITIGNLVLDGSLLSKIREAVRNAQSRS